MHIPRTDLALESVPPQGEESGVLKEEYSDRGFAVADVQIRTKEAADALCKPTGRYISLDTEPYFRREEDAFSHAVELLAGFVQKLLPLNRSDCVLIAGLGNRAITADAVGPETVSGILVTRHLIRQLPEDFSQFRPVCALETGVLGTTGLESAELLRAAVEAVRPDALIAVDALAARDRSRLCRTIQLTDSGIVPGSGVGNAREELSARTFGLPVLAVGVPTVVDEGEGLILTRRDMDKTLRDLGRLLSCGLNKALQSQLSLADIEYLTGGCFT